MFNRCDTNQLRIDNQYAATKIRAAGSKIMFNVNHVRVNQQQQRDQRRSAKRQSIARETKRRSQNRDHNRAWVRVISVFL